MEKSYYVDVNEFTALHMNQPEPKLEIGSTIYFDKNGPLARIPLDKFVNNIAARYITKFKSDDLRIYWKVTGYRRDIL
jgi:hypothetical protein